MEHPQFERLIEQHSRLIRRVVASYCRHAEDRRDIEQEVIVQLWRSRHRYDDCFATTTWVYRIALNVAISAFRRDRQHRDRTGPLKPEATPPVQARPSVKDEQLQILRQCIADLDELGRALVLLYLDDNDHQTISDILGISRSNVATKLGRIKNKLRQTFEDRHTKDRKDLNHGPR